jgi:hypothetical protein
MKIERLTKEQKSKISKYREKYFGQAVSTEPADRPRAEAAARKMAEIAGIKISCVEWVYSPKQWSSLWDSLRSSLGASLSDSLGASLMDSLRASLWNSLKDSLWDSLWDTGWLAFYSFCDDELTIKINESTREKLRLHNEIAASCFALWIVPGTIILCERPSRIEITDGNVVDIEFNR